jgi:hypothetical protein
MAFARDDQERAEHRVVDRDSDSLRSFRQRDPGENGPEQVGVTIELEREVDFAARETIETREEVFRVPHRRRATARKRQKTSPSKK